MKRIITLLKDNRKIHTIVLLICFAICYLLPIVKIEGSSGEESRYAFTFLMIYGSIYGILNYGAGLGYFLSVLPNLLVGIALITFFIGIFTAMNNKKKSCLVSVVLLANSFMLFLFSMIFILFRGRPTVVILIFLAMYVWAFTFSQKERKYEMPKTSSHSPM